MTIAELVAKISLKGGKETGATMKGLLNSTLATKAALIGAATALYKMSDAARASAMFLDQYQLNTGRSSEQLQRMSFRASQAGVSISELGGTIQKLSEMNAQARLGYGWDPILTRFGLTPGQDPVTQLDKIGAALRRLGSSNPAEAHALASRVGLSDSMYYALMKMGTEQMNKQLILTQKEQQAVVKLNMQWNKFWFYIKQITVKMQALSSKFQTGFVKVLIRASQGFYEMFSRIYKVIEASKALQAVFITLGAILAAAFAPELLLLTGVALVLEDIFTYFEGGDSVTGRIIDWVKSSQELQDVWEGLKTLFKGVQFVWKLMKEEFQYIMEDFKRFTKFLDEHPVLKRIFELAVQAAGQALSTATGPIQATLGGLGRASNAVGSFNAEDFVGAFAGLGNISYNTNIVANIAGTGDLVQDGKNVASFEQGVRQAQGQQRSMSQGSNKKVKKPK